MNGDELKEKLNLRNVRVLDLNKVYILKGQNFEMEVDRFLLETRNLLTGSITMNIYGFEFSCDVRGDALNEKIILESQDSNSFPNEAKVNLNKNIDFSIIPEFSLLESFYDKIYVKLDYDGDPVDFVTWYPILKFSIIKGYDYDYSWEIKEEVSNERLKKIHEIIDKYINVY